MDDFLKPTFLGSIVFLTRTYLTYHLSFKKKFAHIGGTPRTWGIQNIDVFGPNIRIGKNCVFAAGRGDRTTITTFRMNGHEGAIEIGDNVLLMSGIRLSSASKIQVGDDCMLANRCYLTDADWHDIYDRTQPVGRTAPIILEKGVWIGDSAIVCKGVRVGENSIVGAGAVVRRDIPSNVIAVGNPAKVVKKLDPKKVVLMSDLYRRIDEWKRRGR